MLKAGDLLRYYCLRTRQADQGEEISTELREAKGVADVVYNFCRELQEIGFRRAYPMNRRFRVPWTSYHPQNISSLV